MCQCNSNIRSVLEGRNLYINKVSKSVTVTIANLWEPE